MNPIKRILGDFYPSPYPEPSLTCTWDRPCRQARVVDAIIIVFLYSALCVFLGWVILLSCAAVPS